MVKGPSDQLSKCPSSSPLDIDSVLLCPVHQIGHHLSLVLATVGDHHSSSLNVHRSVHCLSAVSPTPPSLCAPIPLHTTIAQHREVITWYWCRQLGWWIEEMRRASYFIRMSSISINLNKRTPKITSNYCQWRGWMIRWYDDTVDDTMIRWYDDTMIRRKL